MSTLIVLGSRDREGEVLVDEILRYREGVLKKNKMREEWREV